MGYYICAEHFAFYASARYTESMAMKVEPIGFGCVCPEANSSNPSHLVRTEPKPIERENTRKAKKA